jgi:predicted nuclease with TOPRIM domain
LVGLRECRGLPFKIDDADDMDRFSQSQISNLKKRSKIASMINDLENRNKKKIMSDCKRVYEFEKANEVIDDHVFLIDNEENNIQKLLEEVPMT